MVYLRYIVSTSNMWRRYTYVSCLDAAVARAAWRTICFKAGGDCWRKVLYIFIYVYPYMYMYIDLYWLNSNHTHIDRAVSKDSHVYKCLPNATQVHADFLAWTWWSRPSAATPRCSEHWQLCTLYIYPYVYTCIDLDRSGSKYTYTEREPYIYIYICIKAFQILHRHTQNSLLGRRGSDLPLRPLDAKLAGCPATPDRCEPAHADRGGPTWRANAGHDQVCS